MSNKKELNYQMCILLTFAISFVILGHINAGQYAIGSLWNWFPYYSFHMPLFVFISGYFYKEENEQHILRFILKKLKAFILPYYVINAISYLISALVLKISHNTIVIGGKFELVRYLVAPWTRTQLVTFSIASWYLICIFLAEVFFILIRALLGLIIKNRYAKEIVMTALMLAAGCLVIIIRMNYDIPDAAIVYLRSVLVLFFLQLGFVYKNFLEEKDKLNSWIYFAIVFAIQLIAVIATRNSSLTVGVFGIEWLDGKGCWFFVVGVTGIALWLRISKLLAQIPARSRLVVFISRNTKYIMASHLLGIFLLNTVLFLLFANGIGRNYVGNFDVMGYRTSLYYACIDNPRMIVFYFAAALGFSLLVSLCICKIKELIAGKILKKQE